MGAPYDFFAQMVCTKKPLQDVRSSRTFPGMNIAQAIIDKFGGVRPCASAVGKAPTTVQSWKDSGHIPAKHQSSVLEAAKRRGIDLSPADFFSPSTEAAE